MIKKTIFLFAVTAGLSGCATTAKQGSEVVSVTATVNEPPKKETEVDCVMNTDSRKLQIDRRPTSCLLSYTKQGRAEKVAFSTMGPQECFKTLSQIRTNLEAAGFRCE